MDATRRQNSKAIPSISGLLGYVLNNERALLSSRLLVSQSIFKEAPSSHIDIGSHIDGFVTHVASFRKRLKVIDIRPVEPSQHSNIEFVQLDLMGLTEIEPVDSVSCLRQ